MRCCGLAHPHSTMGECRTLNGPSNRPRRTRLMQRVSSTGRAVLGLYLSLMLVLIGLGTLGLQASASRFTSVKTTLVHCSSSVIGGVARCTRTIGHRAAERFGVSISAMNLLCASSLTFTRISLSSAKTLTISFLSRPPVSSPGPVVATRSGVLLSRWPIRYGLLKNLGVSTPGLSWKAVA